MIARRPPASMCRMAASTLGAMLPFPKWPAAW